MPHPLLHLSLTPRLGPVLIRRAVHTLGSPEAVLRASAADLERVHGIGPERSAAIADGLRAVGPAADEEIRLCEQRNVRLVTMFDDEYPPLLNQLPDAPPILYVRGFLRPEIDRFSLALVGSRSCTPYGIEQAERFSLMLAQSGLTIVSGGARGIDAAAHRGALRAQGRTVVVMGCGLAHIYPPEHAEMYEEVVSRSGAIVSELPMSVAPARENFPRRNRIISGMSLGVLVIEAGAGSGSLITARVAAEEQGREVMAVPGRIDSPASRGSLELLKKGGAALVTDPADVIEILEAPARHAHAGTHAIRYDQPRADETAPDGLFPAPGAPVFAQNDAETEAQSDNLSATVAKSLTASQRTLLEALIEPRSFDDLTRVTGLDPGVLRADATILEIRRLIAREGPLLARRNERARSR